jgi:hypothetical protein
MAEVTETRHRPGRDLGMQVEGREGVFHDDRPARALDFQHPYATDIGDKCPAYIASWETDIRAALADQRRA